MLNRNYFNNLLGALCAVTAVSTAPSLAASGNGGGYNGPSLKSSSVPVALDRGIRAEEAGKAVRVCLIDGAPGQTSLAERIVAATSSTPFSKFSAYSVSHREDKAGVGGEIRATGSLKSRGTWGESSLQIRTSRSFKLEGEAFGLFNDSVALELFGLPKVTYQSIAEDSGYDDYGRLVEENLVLLGVSIALPDNYEVAAPLYNADTGKKSRLTVNLEEYVQCLQSEIQKRAK